MVGNKSAKKEMPQVIVTDGCGSSQGIPFNRVDASHERVRFKTVTLTKKGFIRYT